MKYDIFISYAGEDRDYVRSLVAALQLDGVSAWYDEHEMKLGDSLRESIDRGLAESRYGIVVLSPHFFAKKWPRMELDGLTARKGEPRTTILPVWHQVTAAEVRSFSLMLAGLAGVRSDTGLRDVVRQILEVVRPELGRTKARVLDDLAAMSASIYGYLVGELKANESAEGLRAAVKTARDALMILTTSLSNISEAEDPAEVVSIVESASSRFANIAKIESRCVICRRQLSEMDRASEHVMKCQMRAMRGFCPECGMRVVRILGMAR